MEDIRCPMCGKSNPLEKEVCQFCQARLKPLISPSSSDDYPSPEGAFTDDAGLPEWLANLQQREEPEEEGSEQQDMDEELAADSPDWLARLKEKPDNEDEPTIIEKADPDQEWLPESDRSDSGDIPEWLASLNPTEESTSESEPAENKETDTDEPVWLSRDRSREKEEASPDKPEPGWLEGEPETGVVLPNQEEGVPDWLAGLAEYTPSENTDETPAAEGAEELSSWLREDPAAAAEPITFEEETPEWMPEQAEEQPPEGEVDRGSAWLEEPETAMQAFTTLDGELPDWLAGLSQEEAEQLLASGDLEEEPETPLEADAEGLPPSDEGLPDWMSEDLPAQAGTEAPVSSMEDPDLAPAELPTWLEAMRPVEDAAPSAPLHDETHTQVERAGPLSGLRGVLPAEAEVARVRKPPSYSLKLQISESQRAHADLLKSILAEEGDPRPVPPPPVVSSQNVLRWLIAAALFLAILWPLITGSPQAPLPSFSPETVDVNRLINALSSEARVLLVFDYEPGLLGEMDTIASTAVDHLMLRGAYLTLVSTSPIGPVVAERFLAQTQASHGYTSGNQYVNLGFIPGGASGLISFAESPQRTLPFTLDGFLAWGSAGQPALPPLQGISRLSDFSMVMVIVDNSDIARNWIEQVQPYLVRGEDQVPLVMLTSAQAEPMVRPYYEVNPRQVQGLISGMRGGAAYALLIGRGELSRTYWPAFSLGLIVAALLIIVAGLVNLAAAALARRKQTEGEGSP
jgi:hypothetical protein